MGNACETWSVARLIGRAAFVLPMGIAAAASQPAAAADPLVLPLEAGQPVEITCTTRALVVADEKFSATRGTFRLRLVLKDATTDPPAGEWSIVTSTPEHTASLSIVHGEACKVACPLVARPGVRPELWAPRRAAPEAMPGEDALTVAAIDTAKSALRATTFRAKELHALEEGECRREP